MTREVLPPPASYPQMLTGRVSVSPHREAFRYQSAGQWISLTWQQTKERAFDLAAGLIELGLQIEDRGGIMAGTSMDWIMADLGILCAGGATTTVYPATSSDDTAYIVNDSACKFIFVDNAEQLSKILAADIPNVHKIITFSDDDASGVADDRVMSLSALAAIGQAAQAATANLVEDRIADIEPEHLATLIYTSGTTGRPKGVRLVHANWTYEGLAVEETNLATEEDFQYLWLPLSHVLGKMLIAAQMRIGYTTAVDGNLEHIVDNLAIIKPRWMGGAPRIFEKVRNKVTLTAQGGSPIKKAIYYWAFRNSIHRVRLLQQGKTPPTWMNIKFRIGDVLVFKKIRARLGGNLRFLVSGSAALSIEVAEWFEAAGIPMLEGYGLTETAAACCVNLLWDRRLGTVGPALPGTEFKIADDGEIMVRGGGIMRGYHNNPEATAEVLTEDGWFYTGDIGEFDDGFLRITDRKKDLVKTSGGKFVAPQKLEGAFKAVCPYASQIVVTGDGRRFISALITLDEPAIAEWAAAHGISDTGPEVLAQHPQVRELIDGYVTKMNERLHRWETVKKFTILPRDLTIDDGELTPSLKVRRKEVEKEFAHVIDAMYAEE